MGARAAAKNRLPISRAEEIRTLVLILVSIGVPVLGLVLAVAATTQPDLSDLTPTGTPYNGGYSVLAWSALLRDAHHAPVLAGGTVAALGYMMDGDRALAEGEVTQAFVLLPDPGNALHPAHRFGEQMIEVHLAGESRVRFSRAALVWVRGVFRSLPGDSSGSIPLYRLDQARCQLADKQDVRKFFQ